MDQQWEEEAPYIPLLVQKKRMIIRYVHVIYGLARQAQRLGRKDQSELIDPTLLAVNFHGT